ncbi:hypothetical protein [Methylobacterium oxalidis]|uniref:Toxin-antitoxin system HicB family antitoxin n=1 Tax=Methylobacterium oxalidis TaxID=944322 RepID=A0A512IX64_9HYPH|nr:hypothetical protein [Methylobacterium oxalidis]GEP02285.1 hypothetical protein MOX02_03230 [Methylobacterium oxalidis]GJE32275.1 hypothetical protein LDDCCGHA_2461 [Methylobacterium oxalidis]GLS62230.1 hypothetical protein GCM10007888_06110 [Methylobacterium oxalidis]
MSAGRTIITLDLPDSLAGSIEARAGRAGMTASSWLSDQLETAFGSGILVRESEMSLAPRKHRKRRSKASRERHRARETAQSEA